MKYIKTDLFTELPTWIAIFSVYFLWWIVLSNFYNIPFAPLFLMVILTFHGSVQHEILHGHPTSHQGFNNLLAFPSLALWTPYLVYKNSHLKHHEDINLTIPIKKTGIFEVKIKLHADVLINVAINVAISEESAIEQKKMSISDNDKKLNKTTNSSDELELVTEDIDKEIDDPSLEKDLKKNVDISDDVKIDNEEISETEKKK